MGPVRWLFFFFSEFGTLQSHDRWQIAFDNPFGLDLVKINVYAKFYQTISMVQKLGPFSLFFFLFFFFFFFSFNEF